MPAISQFCRYSPHVLPTSILLIFSSVDSYRPYSKHLQLKIKWPFSNTTMTLVEPFVTDHRDSLQRATVYDHACSFVYLFRCRTLWGFVVNSDLFFSFHWHYSPLWALACRKISFHFFLSVINSVHLLTSNPWRSLSTSSFQALLGLVRSRLSWV